MRLLLQLDGDLPERFPNHRRRLYVFSCTRKTCKRKYGSVRALRETRMDEKRRSRKQAITESSAEVEPEGSASSKGQQVAEGPLRDLGRELFGGKVGSSTMSSSTNPFALSSGTPLELSTSGHFLASFPALNSLAAKPAQRLTGSTSSNAFISPASSSIATPFAISPMLESPAVKPAQKSAVDDMSVSFAARVSLGNSTSAPAGVTPSPSSSRQAPSASSHLPFESWPADAELPRPYPSYYLEADFETLDVPSVDSSIAKHMHNNNDDDEDNGMDSSSKAGNSNSRLQPDDSSDAFESSIDKTFQRLADRVAQNPLQVLRYEFGGLPLLYSIDDSVGKQLSPSISRHHSHQQVQTVKDGGIGETIAKCSRCGASRCFEFQLMPHAIVELERLTDDNDDDDDDHRQLASPKELQAKAKAKEDGKTKVKGKAKKEARQELSSGDHGSILEWGTVIVAVCSVDCLPLDDDTFIDTTTTVTGSSGRGIGDGRDSSTVIHQIRQGIISSDGTKIIGGDGGNGSGEKGRREEGRREGGYVEEWVGVQWE